MEDGRWKRGDGRKDIRQKREIGRACSPNAPNTRKREEMREK
jgi:hypothetical protein